MMKKSYYCLVAGLPDLFFNENKTGADSLMIRKKLSSEINESDFQLVKLLFLPFDNKNLLTLLFEPEKDFLQEGNFKKSFLKEQIALSSEIPEYMIDFISWVKLNEIKTWIPEAENKLLHLFYKFVLQEKNMFVGQWFTFELNLKNTLTALNCGAFNYKTEQHLIKTNNSVVHDLLKNNHLKHDLFEEELPFAETIFRVAQSNKSMLEKEKAMDNLKWDWLDEHTFFHYFTIEKILSFLLKLQIIERWNILDKQSGEQFLQKILNELKTSYVFPEEYSTVK